MLVVVVMVWWWAAGAAARVAGAPRRVAGAPRRVPRDVTTRRGVVRGYLVGSTRPAHYAFLGVPYARAPTRENRFKAPEPPDPWDGIFEATHRIKCPQAGGGGAGEDEHCLLASVFAPEHAAACCALPVLVHVHDGAFQNGWGAFQPPTRLLRQDFVIVTFNYRLGALGFLCLGTAEVPGNAGLKDQIAALYWVRSNIASFGGNPHDVTVYGTGSGAASVQLLLLSGLTKGLVQRVILESGSVLSPSSMMYDPFSSALDFAISLGYVDEGNIEDLERFYHEVLYTDLLNTSVAFLPSVENNIYYSNSLISQDPINILSEGNFDKVPMLIIYTNAEEISIIEENSERFQEIPEDFEDLLPNNLEFNSEGTKHRVSELIKDFYFKDVAEDNTIQSYIDYINDIFMEYPVIKFAMMYASKSSLPVYVMKYSYNKDQISVGANYGDVLNNAFTKENLDNDDTAGKLLTLWSNFIKMGDPTPLTTLQVPVIWQPVNVRDTDNHTNISKASYLVFDRTVTMNKPETSQSLTFWDHVYCKFYKLNLFDSQFQVTDTEGTMDLDETTDAE